MNQNRKGRLRLPQDPDERRFRCREKKGRQAHSRVTGRPSFSRRDVRFKTVDDFAVMSMVERGLGTSILPELILQRIPFNIVTREIDAPAKCTLGMAIIDRNSAPLAVKRFMDYINVIP